MKKRLDGWHVIVGNEVYIENGFILRGRKEGRTTYPYHFEKNLHAYVRQEKIVPERLYVETYKML